MSAVGFIRRRALRTFARPPVFAPRTVDRARWYDPDFAPHNQPLAVQASDTLGPYTLPMRCIRTPSGWITAHTKAPLQVTVTGWRYDERGVRG